MYPANGTVLFSLLTDKTKCNNNEKNNENKNNTKKEIIEKEKEIKTKNNTSPNPKDFSNSIPLSLV
ncbi:hypothetical protein LNQ49_04660 [Flavobacterium sp. F-65]|uniref:Uncharacterized protein n=1 Tax=Flavobacterium pisciphilum TaxID=2893755 RepID=A0ABS8MQF3_9FLAO|nr:hypothetical protein [Flavobacterium sp. F-65]MCC9070888.1 hypothetical protein [Flavobacterium sp. F-65]